MENITFTLSDLHIHGTAFFDYLKLRKQFFVDTLRWDIPHNDLFEMDQYDNPLAHYSLVLREGVVLGGMRAMSTTSHWGEHTYLVRDAVAGKLPNIPKQIYGSEVDNPEVWECTRLVISEELTQQHDRVRCLSLILDGMAETARQHGASELMSLTRASLVRSLRQLGWQCDRVGEAYRSPDDGHRYAVLSMPTSKVTEAEFVH
ncbi:acyl-homoserine-lactone synthase [Defluviimonas aestuarii]|uniref:acyl-homoserine-lactone synthase n=1 Tax=Albidovulum aestuarii TaxID=1130726 RepID=UPI00249C7A59|nr:acyl-homoserine-lactone synthase [Defluviimonas aestuarii]MDI3334931.1 acyl-homoserine-lactone synthase [Defluviimonas aestuarii]